MLGTLSDFGLGFALSYFAGKAPERANVIVSQALVTTLLLRGVALAGGLAFLPSVQAFASVRPAAVWIGLSALLTGSLGGIVNAFFLGTGRVRVVNSLNLLSPWLWALAVIACWAGGARDAEPYVLAYALTQAIGFAVSLWAGMTFGRLRWHWSRDGWGQMLVYGAKTQVASLAAQTNLRLDQALMAILVAPADLGFYVVAVATSSIVSPIYSGLNVVLAPAVIGAPEPRSGALRAMRTLALGVVLGGGAALALSILAPWLLPALFGSRFQGAIGMARILLLASVLQGANLLLSTALRGMNRPGAPAVAEGAGAVLTIGLLVALLPVLGGTGAAIASLVSYTVVAVIEASMVWRAGTLRLADVTTELKGIITTLQPRWRRAPHE